MPLIACDCAVCTSADPHDVRTRTGAAVQLIDPQGKPRTVLIDVTPDLRQQALRHDLWRCDAILFTHNHVDHIFGLDEVRRFNAVMREPIDIHAEGYVLDSLRRVYKHIFDPAANVNDSFVATLIAHQVPEPPESPRAAAPAINLWGMSFTPIRLMHGRLPILGWRIEREQASRPPAIEPSSAAGRGSAAGDASLDGSMAGGLDPFPLAYCTDVSSIPPYTWPRLEGLRTLVLDALRIRRHPTHLTIDQAVENARQIGADQTYFIHMSHELGHAVTNAELPPGIRLAHDGLVLGSLGEAGVEAFDRDKARLAEAMRKRDKSLPDLGGPVARSGPFSEG